MNERKKARRISLLDIGKKTVSAEAVVRRCSSEGYS